MANNLIVPDWLNNCTALVAQMSPTERAQTLYCCKVISKKLEPEVTKALFDGTIDSFEFIANGVPVVVTLSRGKQTIKDVIVKDIDYDKAVAFAKEHNFEVPMIPERVIPAEIDKIKLENMDWFQNNADQFVTKKVEQKQTKSYDRVLFKEAK